MDFPSYGFKEIIRRPIPERQQLIMRLKKLEKMHATLEPSIMCLGGMEHPVKKMHNQIIREHQQSVSDAIRIDNGKESFEMLRRECGRYTHQIEQLGAKMSDLDPVDKMRIEVGKIRQIILQHSQDSSTEAGSIVRVWKFVKEFYEFARNADWKVVL